MNTKGKPLVLRMTKRTRQMLVGAALFGWILYLGARFFNWYFEQGGAQKIEDWEQGR